MALFVSWLPTATVNPLLKRAKSFLKIIWYTEKSKHNFTFLQSVFFIKSCILLTERIKKKEKGMFGWVQTVCKSPVCWSFWCLPTNQMSTPNQIQTSALFLSSSRPVHLWHEVSPGFQPRQLISFHLSLKFNTQGDSGGSGLRLMGFAQITWHT